MFWNPGGRAAANLRERGDAAQVADAAGVGDRRADEVDQLLGDELLELPDRGEDLADRQRHGYAGSLYSRDRTTHPGQRDPPRYGERQPDATAPGRAETRSMS